MDRIYGLTGLQRSEFMDIEQLKERLVLPVIVAPMFLVSGKDLLVAACKAGVVGSMPAMNARSSEDLERILREIQSELSGEYERPPAPYAINLVVQGHHAVRLEHDLGLMEKYRVPIVITSFGYPKEVAARVHAYGGLVFHDVATLRHAEKAIEAGVDGLILLTGGAGGHTGHQNPFAFVSNIREIWDGAILLAGAISNGQSILAAEALGADFAYMGTRFAATEPSAACPEYKALLQSQRTEDIITTDRITGVAATFMKGSLERVGLDPQNLPPLAASRRADLPDGIKAWRDIWSAGHGVGSIKTIPPVDRLVATLVEEYRSAANRLGRAV